MSSNNKKHRPKF